MDRVWGRIPPRPEGEEEEVQALERHGVALGKQCF